jgi:hypothetical protein
MAEWFESMAADGDPPQALLERPEVLEHLVPVYEAFGALWGDRQLGAFGGVGAIPFQALDAYARRYGFDDREEFQRLHMLIARMDGVYLAYVAEKTQAPPTPQQQPEP